MKLFAIFVIAILLLQGFAEAVNETQSTDENVELSVKKKHIHPKHIHPKKINCSVACARRCKKSSRKKVCNRACKSCCKKCNCVPPGTYGNKKACPCYASLKTHGNKPKCP